MFQHDIACGSCRAERDQIEAKISWHDIRQVIDGCTRFRVYGEISRVSVDGPSRYSVHFRQPSPNDFLFFTEDHGWHIRPPENDEDESCFTFLRVEPGQIVKFDLNRVFGDFELTVHDDRTFEVDGEIPAEANCFRIDHDIYTLQQSLEALVNGDGTPWSNDILEPGTHLMDAYWWSEKSSSFRFEIEDGKGKFVNCTGAS